MSTRKTPFLLAAAVALTTAAASTAPVQAADLWISAETETAQAVPANFNKKKFIFGKKKFVHNPYFFGKKKFVSPKTKFKKKKFFFKF